ncbi:MAG: hypothetical protein HY908_13965 [Myxococcales bacterium]|nr:hypothetical protein [Myxococcales bacterium]
MTELARTGRVLLRAAFAASGALALLGVPLATLPACRCSEETTVFEIERARYDALAARFGMDGMPTSECEPLCNPVLPQYGGDGGDGGGGTGPGGPTTSRDERYFSSISACRLVTIDLGTPAILCTGQGPC